MLQVFPCHKKTNSKQSGNAVGKGRQASDVSGRSLWPRASKIWQPGPINRKPQESGMLGAHCHTPLLPLPSALAHWFPAQSRPPLPGASTLTVPAWHHPVPSEAYHVGLRRWHFTQRTRHRPQPRLQPPSDRDPGAARPHPPLLYGWCCGCPAPFWLLYAGLPGWAMTTGGSADKVPVTARPTRAPSPEGEREVLTPEGTRHSRARALRTRGTSGTESPAPVGVAYGQRAEVFRGGYLKGTVLLSLLLSFPPPPSSTVIK